ncbi:MAG: bifunctional response regulator/alkaline phosphatase family protein [Candidatus Poribacteria bacterium]|nr:bifunctional response regulator/alkaline phosphatase family protein [Candidatus Poribacteria bacterium]
MENTKGRILWIDNALRVPLASPYLKSEQKLYVRFLEYHGYDVSLTDSGDEGIALLKDKTFHGVLLNYEMPTGNVDLLSRIRKEDAHIPIILLTKSGGQEIMEKASLHGVDDVLIMPTNPRQLVSSLAFLLEKQNIRETYTPQAYVDNFNKQYTLEHNQTQTLEDELHDSDWQAWIDTYIRFVEWDIKLDSLSNVDELKTIHASEKREANSVFADYIQNTYSLWLESEDSPTLSVDVFYKYVIPEIQMGKSVLFVVMDCMRLDHWLKIEPLLYRDFHMTKHYYYSILPTSTHYARNAIFSGLFPRDLAERYPNLYAEPDEEHTSINRYEKELMYLQLERHGIALKPSPHYFKIFDARGEIQYLQWLTDANRISLAAVVVDFLDMLTHLRSETPLFQQLISNEEAFRALVQTWFQNSRIYKIIKLAAERGITTIITSDHGSVLCQNAVKISSPYELSSGLRAKKGKDISCSPEAGLLINNPEEYRLPHSAADKNYILAKEDYYFVYERQFNVYKEIFQNSFQHGGISFEEMILPCVVLEPR